MFVYCIEYTVIVTIYTVCNFLYWFLSQPLLPWHHILLLLPVHAHALIISRSSCSGLLQHGATVCFFLSFMLVIGLMQFIPFMLVLLSIPAIHFACCFIPVSHLIYDFTSVMLVFPCLLSTQFMLVVQFLLVIYSCLLSATVYDHLSLILIICFMLVILFMLSILFMFAISSCLLFALPYLSFLSCLSLFSIMLVLSFMLIIFFMLIN